MDALMKCEKSIAECYVQIIQIFLSTYNDNEYVNLSFMNDETDKYKDSINSIKLICAKLRELLILENEILSSMSFAKISSLNSEHNHEIEDTEESLNDAIVDNRLKNFCNSILNGRFNNINVKDNEKGTTIFLNPSEALNVLFRWSEMSFLKDKIEQMKMDSESFNKFASMYYCLLIIKMSENIIFESLLLNSDFNIDTQVSSIQSFKKIIKINYSAVIADICNIINFLATDDFHELDSSLEREFFVLSKLANIDTLLSLLPSRYLVTIVNYINSHYKNKEVSGYIKILINQKLKN